MESVSISRSIFHEGLIAITPLPKAPFKFETLNVSIDMLKAMNRDWSGKVADRWVGYEKITTRDKWDVTFRNNGADTRGDYEKATIRDKWELKND